MIIGTAMIAGVSGYMIGIASSLGLIPNPFVAKEPRQRGVDNYDDEEESEDEDIDESILDHAPNWANGVEADKRDGLRATAAGKAAAKKEPVKTSWEDNKYEEYKLILVVRTDLGMTKGPSHLLSLPFSY
jgi:PTH2 family peptidyl-tRNA hydrolase